MARLSPGTIVPLALALVLALVPAAHAGARDAALPGNKFATTPHTYYLTGQQGTTNTIQGLLLDESPPAAQAMHTFLVPGVSVLGVVQQPNTQSWYTKVGWDKDLEATSDSSATLYFVADVQAVSIFEVRLYDVSQAGVRSLVDTDQQQFVTALSPTAVDFPLHTAGLQLHKEHILQLEVFAQTLTAAVVLDYGGSTPSALEGFTTRWLDSDGDGVPDSDELAMGRNPLNPNDPVLAVNEGKDTDADGLSDRTEATIKTDPNKVDSDGDGFGDGLEVFAGTNPLDKASHPYDVNHNGLPDSFETTYFNNTTVTPTANPCTPGPGCIDANADPDHDRCSNLCEAVHGTDPNNSDSDGDGILDGDELDQRTDPTSAASVMLGPSGVPEPVATAAAFAIGSSICLIALVRRP